MWKKLLATDLILLIILDKAIAADVIAAKADFQKRAKRERGKTERRLELLGKTMPE